MILFTIFFREKQNIYLEENIEALAELFETNDVFDIEEMVIALMN